MADAASLGALVDALTQRVEALEADDDFAGAPHVVDATVRTPPLDGLETTAPAANGVDALAVLRRENAALEAALAEQTQAASALELQLGKERYRVKHLLRTIEALDAQLDAATASSAPASSSRSAAGPR